MIGARTVKVPYRQDRAVPFDSHPYHETGALNLRYGNENRRISATMLYGTRGG